MATKLGCVRFLFCSFCTVLICLSMCLLCFALWFCIWTPRAEIHRVAGFGSAFQLVIAAYVLIGVAILSLVGALIGLYAAVKDSAGWIILALVDLAVVFVSSVSVGVFCALFLWENADILKHIEAVQPPKFKSAIEHNYTNDYQDRFVKRFVDNAQLMLHCCGANSWEDWKLSRWYKKPPPSLGDVPESCCPIPVAKGKHDAAGHCSFKVPIPVKEPYRPFTDGCDKKLESLVQINPDYWSIIFSFIGIGCLLGVYVAMGMLLSAWLRRLLVRVAS